MPLSHIVHQFFSIPLQSTQHTYITKRMCSQFQCLDSSFTSFSPLIFCRCSCFCCCCCCCCAQIIGVAGLVSVRASGQTSARIRIAKYFQFQLSTLHSRWYQHLVKLLVTGTASEIAWKIASCYFRCYNSRFFLIVAPSIVRNAEITDMFHLLASHTAQCYWMLLGGSHSTFS